MKILDSSVIVAYLNEDDSLHDRAIRLELEKGVTNELVFAEVANVMQKRVKNKHHVENALKKLAREMPIVLVSLGDMQKSLEVFSENYPKLSFTDCILIVQSVELGAEIITFDEDIISAIRKTA